MMKHCYTVSLFTVHMYTDALRNVVIISITIGSSQRGQTSTILYFVISHISCQNYFCRIAKIGEDILNWAITSSRFSVPGMMVLTFNFGICPLKVNSPIWHWYWLPNFTKIVLLLFKKSLMNIMNLSKMLNFTNNKRTRLITIPVLAEE